MKSSTKMKTHGLCESTFKGLKMKDEILLDTLKNEDGINIFTVGSKPGLGKIKINSLKLINLDINLSKKGVGGAYLEIGFDKGKSNKVARSRKKAYSYDCKY